jgi:hypothetical protein
MTESANVIEGVIVPLLTWTRTNMWMSPHSVPS